MYHVNTQPNIIFCKILRSKFPVFQILTDVNFLKYMHLLNSCDASSQKKNKSDNNYQRNNTSYNYHFISCIVLECTEESIVS